MLLNMAEQSRSAPSWHQKQRSAPPAPPGLCLWILEEEQENNLAECRDALCKDWYQIWHSKWQLPGWKGQRSALFKWKCSSRKAELLNLSHLRGEKNKAGTDTFLPFYPCSFAAGTMIKCKPSSSPAPQHSETKQDPATCHSPNEMDCGNELPSIINQSLVPVLQTQILVGNFCPGVQADPLRTWTNVKESLLEQPLESLLIVWQRFLFPCSLISFSTPKNMWIHLIKHYI